MFNFGTILLLHSLTRWLLFVSLPIFVLYSYWGWKKNREYKYRDGVFRFTVVFIAHTQLVFGYILYFQSPLVDSFWGLLPDSLGSKYLVFFAVLHPFLMSVAMAVLTLGSAKARREKIANTKYQLQLITFSVAFVLILFAIPWNFLDLVGRPLLP